MNDIYWNNYLFDNNNQSVRLYRIQPGATSIPRKVENVSTQDISKQYDSMIFGERGSGLRNVFDWLWKSREQSVKRVLLKHDPAEITVEGFSSVESKRMMKTAISLASSETSAQCLETLRNWGTKVRDLHLVIYLPGPTLSKNLVEAFRSLRDEGRNEVKLIFLGSSADPSFDHGLRSGYLSLSTVYRLARLGLDQINQGLEDLQKTVKPEVVYEILRVTGGQPLLIEHMFKTLKRIAQVQGDWSVDHVKLAFDLIVENLPPQVDFWQRDLRVRLGADQELREMLGQYLSGSLQAQRAVPYDEITLFITGWLGYDLYENWGISSHVHKYMIRQLLLGY